MKPWLFLGIAIVSEVTATSALRYSEGFTRLWPSVLVVLGYGLSFYFLSQCLRTVPVGVAYALWSGVGMALIALIGWWFMGQKLDAPAIAGMGLIVTGIIVMMAFSKTTSTH